MSEIHHVVPIIYNAAYNEDFFKECDTNFQAMFKSSAFRYIFSQIQRTNHFLEVYKKLSKKNIKIFLKFSYWEILLYGQLHYGLFLLYGLLVLLHL